jgi:hypothetical protein
MSKDRFRITEALFEKFIEDWPLRKIEDKILNVTKPDKLHVLNEFNGMKVITNGDFYMVYDEHKIIYLIKIPFSDCFIEVGSL